MTTKELQVLCRRLTITGCQAQSLCAAKRPLARNRRHLLKGTKEF